MILHKVDLSFLVLTESIQLEHLNQALTRFLNDVHFKVLIEQLHTNVKVIENFINELYYFVFPGLHHIIKLSQYFMYNVQEYLYAPVLLVL